MTATHVKTQRRFSRPILLIAAGAFVVVGALISSDIADRLALTSARSLAGASANPVALEFATPDYTAVWVWIGIAAAGLGVLIAGIVAAVRKRRSS